MFRSRALGVALFAFASLCGCSIVGNDDSSSALSDPAVQSCLRDTIEACYAQNLSPEECAALIENTCLGGTDPGDPGNPGDPNDPECHQRVFDDCVAAGVDEMTCWALADDQCRDPSGDPPGGPNDPPCTDPPFPDPTCLESVRADCLAMGVDPMTCEAYAWQVCTNTDPPPGPDPMCVEEVRQQCLAQGVDPMTCEAYANQVCDPANGGGSGGGGMGGGNDPGMPDPNTGENPGMP
jgi:hypothetical protein